MKVMSGSFSNIFNLPLAHFPNFAPQENEIKQQQQYASHKTHPISTGVFKWEMFHLGLYSSSAISCVLFLQELYVFLRNNILQKVPSYIYAEMEVITFAHENVIGKTMVAFTQKASSVEGHVSKREKTCTHAKCIHIISLSTTSIVMLYICGLLYGDVWTFPKGTVSATKVFFCVMLLLVTMSSLRSRSAKNDGRGGG